MSKSILLLVATSIIPLLLLTTSSYYNNQGAYAQDQNVGLLTHHDPKSLFTIQYPSDWRVLGNSSGHISFTSPFDPTYNRKTSSLSIQVTNQSTGIRSLTLDQVVNNFKKSRTGYMNFKETGGVQMIDSFRITS